MFSGSDEGRQDRDGGEVEGVFSDGAGCVHAHGQELQDTAQAFQGVISEHCADCSSTPFKKDFTEIVSFCVCDGDMSAEIIQLRGRSTA